MRYEFELGHHSADATKNICCVKGEDTVDHSTVSGWLKKFCFGYKNFNNQKRSDRNMNSEAVLLAKEAKC